MNPTDPFAVRHKLPLEFVPSAGRDRDITAEKLAEDLEFATPIENVAKALGDVWDDPATGWTTWDDSNTSETISFAGELEVDGWIVRVRD